MRVIHVLRKPLSEGTVAGNVLKHGCGGINISASRIGSDSTRRPTGTKMFGKGTGWNEHNMKDIMGGSDSGRWPANVILTHLDGCRCDGVKRVSGQNPKYANESKGGTRGSDFAMGSRPSGVGIGHADKDGKESVANWICEPGCPVARLDEQSGTTTSTGGNHSGHNAFGQDSGWNPHQNRPTTIHRVGDKGGASRFFKQVGGSKA